MDADEAQAREYLAALVSGPEPIRPGQPALAVPEQRAEVVIAVARRLALKAAPRPGTGAGPNPAPELLSVAEALVVDEHPAAADWSAADRDRLVGWVAVLIEHRGEDGVQDLVRALAAELRDEPGGSR
ncbi:hypothetical protein [Streptomyces sp. Y1]|uniref:DUF2267 domain-containing protein n=1 Tax=Streptomyces sp. Y1 TaxID=3238634 RepID=A0AB39TB28_9ACTN